MNNPHDANRESLFDALCVRGLSRDPSTFPETEEQIDAFMVTHTPDAEMEKYFASIKNKMIQQALSHCKKQEHGIPNFQRIIDLIRKSLCKPHVEPATLYRKPEDSKLSEEMNAEIEDRIKKEENKQSDAPDK